MGEATLGDLAPLIVDAELALLAHVNVALMVANAIIGTAVVWGVWFLCRGARQ